MADSVFTNQNAGMRWLNHQHLLYFWVTEQEGSISAAAARLRLAPSTVSAQVKLLEEHLGQPLFLRSGRRLVPTPAGRLAAEYARDIFGLDQELRQVLEGGLEARYRARLRVGLGNNLPKFLGHAILARAEEEHGEAMHLVVQQGDLDFLVSELSLHHLDIALTDRPVAFGVREHLRAELLGESPIGLFGTAALVERYGGDLPGSLGEAAFLLPEPRSAMRQLVEEWFVEVGLQPRIAAEFTDNGMLKLFGEDGWGFFPAPTVVAEHIRHTHRVEQLLEIEGRRERFYALVRAPLAGSEVVEGVLRAAREILGAAG